MNIKMNGNESKSQKQLRDSTSALQVSSSSPRCFKTWTQLNWTELDWTGPKTKPNQINLDETCILATLSIPANLGSSWSTLQPSLVNLSSTLQGALLDNPWWTLVDNPWWTLLDNPWWTLVDNPWWQPGNPSWLLNCGKPVEEKWTPGHPVDPLQIHQITHSSAFIA